MHFLTVSVLQNGQLHWDSSSNGNAMEAGLKLGFVFTTIGHQYQRREALNHLENLVKRNQIGMLARYKDYWAVNLDRLVELLPDLRVLEWFRGVVKIQPDVECIDATQRPPNMPVHNRYRTFKTTVAFYITDQELQEEPAMDELNCPIEIQESLKRFREDYPDTRKTAFIIMEFANTKAHRSIVDGIKKTLEQHGITAIRADEKEYHDDLYYNILTYIYGCDFAVSVYERITSDNFNPNVSFEVGYVMGLRKPVCILKDNTLKTLNSDLLGKLYRPFDPQKPTATIAKVLKQWVEDKGFGKEAEKSV